MSDHIKGPAELLFDRYNKIVNQFPIWAKLANEDRNFWIQFACAFDKIIEPVNLKIEGLKDLLHRDQTGLAGTLNLVQNHVKGSTWIADDRGSYEWNDDRYRKETRDTLDVILAICEKGLRESGERAHAVCCRGELTPREKGENLIVEDDQIALRSIGIRAKIEGDLIIINRQCFNGMGEEYETALSLDTLNALARMLSRKNKP